MDEEIARQIHSGSGKIQLVSVHGVLYCHCLARPDNPVPNATVFEVTGFPSGRSGPAEQHPDFFLEILP
jgi:hypothetical protein